MRAAVCHSPNLRHIASIEPVTNSFTRGRTLTVHPKPYTLNPKPYTPNPKPYTPNPKPYTPKIPAIPPKNARNSPDPWLHVR